MRYLECAGFVAILNPEADLIPSGGLAVTTCDMLLYIIPKFWLLSVAPNVDCVCLFSAKCMLVNGLVLEGKTWFYLKIEIIPRSEHTPSRL